MISSIGASIILVSLAQGIFGTQVSRFPPDLFPTTPLTLGDGVVIAPIQLLVLGVALVLIVGLHLLIARTQTGRAIRAIAWSERTARLLGINVDLVIGPDLLRLRRAGRRGRRAARAGLQPPRADDGQPDRAGRA